MLTLRRMFQKRSCIENAVEKILKKGTRVVSFDYHGRRRNVIVGCSACQKQPTWGNQVNRGIREYRGRKYLVGKPMNDGTPYKVFLLDDIENPSRWLA